MPTDATGGPAFPQQVVKSDDGTFNLADAACCGDGRGVSVHPATGLQSPWGHPAARMRIFFEPARFAMTGPHISSVRPGFAYPDDLVGALDAPVYIAQGCVTGTVHRQATDCYTYASTSEVMLPRMF